MSIQKIIFSCIIVFTFYFCGKNRKVQQKIEQTQSLAIDKNRVQKIYAEQLNYVAKQNFQPEIVWKDFKKSAKGNIFTSPILVHQAEIEESLLVYNENHQTIFYQTSLKENNLSYVFIHTLSGDLFGILQFENEILSKMFRAHCSNERQHFNLDELLEKNESWKLILDKFLLNNDPNDPNGPTTGGGDGTIWIEAVVIYPQDGNSGGGGGGGINWGNWGTSDLSWGNNPNSCSGGGGGGTKPPTIQVQKPPEPTKPIDPNLPTAGDPVKNMEIVPSGGWNMKGGRWGKGVRTERNKITGKLDPRNHWGVDIKSDVNKNLYSTHAGKVSVIKNTVPPGKQGEGGLGNFIKVETSVNGQKITIVYGHLNQVNVSVGQTLTVGQIVGLTGNTGNASDKDIVPHVHIEVHKPNGDKIDPEPFLTTQFNQNGKPKN